jgi:hypothetical protein
MLQEVEGKLPEDKEKMLAVIERFQSLSPEERDNFKLGRRLGIYSRLGDLNDVYRHKEVMEMMGRLGGDGEGRLDEVLFGLMERYI